ncbi:Sigma-54 dependent DNA-binding response regulator [Marinobacterium lacunae]|uniref:Sigma-54 dependent DNA-binding response regulator n=1 Tax=Marinobacterium lacunae TaxID=1232683 RepID=A0A081FVD2_9GAMM|nr:sigma-54 dependent transcriptional regulator [Marinobacterium lacunae]KEA62487.1 Sigma-54 dependent DNA-binding response regulator [Marinobacterium lacunae]
MKQNLYPNFGVLLVDDEASFLRTFSLMLESQAGINHLYLCDDSRDAMATIAREPIGLVLLDLTMPHLSGEALLKQIVEEYPDVGVIVVSGLNQLETAVSCIRLGAFDYFIKTTEENRLIDGIRRAISMLEMRRENLEMRRRFMTDTLERPAAFEHIVTADKGMRSVFQYLEAISTSSQPVLITGESGTGKELIAQAIHELSNRPGPMVSVNVAGLDDSIFADTLFGHRRGAFTGADKARAGMIEQAGNGTLFLDEIGDLSPASQVKLLRLLQEAEYYPLGSDRPKRSHARILVATHHDLERKQREGSFRKDLYYRLRTHQVELPPLRQRKEDIGLLLDYFLSEAADELGRPKPTLPGELTVLLMNYAFPGNVRELRALCYDALGQHRGGVLSMEVFKRAVIQSGASAEPSAASLAPVFAEEQPLPTLQQAADMLVAEAMRRTRGNQSLASRLLGISQPALSKRLKKTSQPE